MVSLPSYSRDADPQPSQNDRAGRKKIRLDSKSSFQPISNGIPLCRGSSKIIQRVVADAGAYFALVQFFSWIVSGMAWG
jgi:hypothetical protein